MTQNMVEVTQAAREAAIPYLQDSEWDPAEIRCGEADTHFLVQAFASFQAALASKPKPAVDADAVYGLKPCPFCGSNAHHGIVSYYGALNDVTWDDGSPIDVAHFVNCVSCGASVGHVSGAGGYRTPEIARDAWNSRTVLSALPAPPAEREKALREAAAAFREWLFSDDGRDFEDFVTALIGGAQ